MTDLKTSEYKDFIRQKMGDYRFTHSVNVADEAVALAKIYGCDEELAYTAGILHDVTKEFPKDEQLQIIADGGIILDSVQKNAPKLWHSISGSVYVRDYLGIKNNDIINAVRYHTTGRAGMSLLEKIIYIADFTSAERSYKDVDIMRGLSRKTLEDAMLFSCKFTIGNLSSKELAIHPDQLDCYNELVLNIERE
ncbi:bis(5'-nucleosyl)-tetraphosphatase (symmetrical) YqeK [uncultured Ruminococcus sp.]|uniref:bis(5'-nucleosyl)-tetraphosphatase (symmetrical) YqeK n=1 Tax=uncultured Ruminococcus sp. TaxID=165186 RepID=UPI00292EB511|nr:bis(5'-nucleosyl)-tetraphosphatase (symmetrical) YqeK [uncultured Ruminococcus sp.]